MHVLSIPPAFVLSQDQTLKFDSCHHILSKKFRQVELIEDTIEGLQAEFTDIVERIKLVRYERGGVETGLYSSQADVRIIWGGDNTIEEIRKECPHVTVIVGGAVLTPALAIHVGADFYAKDAMESVRIASGIVAARYGSRWST